LGVKFGQYIASNQVVSFAGPGHSEYLAVEVLAFSFGLAFKSQVLFRADVNLNLRRHKVSPHIIMNRSLPESAV
jgi:hypothetical protein